MNPLDRLTSLVRKGDSITIQITPTEKGITVLLVPRLAGRSPDDGDEATRKLVLALTFPHVIEVASGELLSVEMAKSLDTLAGDQASGLEALDALERRTSMVREASANAGKAKDASKPVTVETADDESSETKDEAAPTAAEPPLGAAVPSVFGDDD